MNINIYDFMLFPVANIGENFVSLFWEECYNDVGNFTLELVATDKLRKTITRDMYVERSDRKNVMVIKTVQDTGAMLVLSGKQATRVLDDVPFLATIKMGQNIETTIYDEYEKINFPATHFVKNGLSLKADFQTSNKSFLEVITKYGKLSEFGFLAYRDKNKILFELHQPENSSVIFSEFLGNLKIDKVTFSSANYKREAIVLGQGVGDERIMTRVYWDGNHAFDGEPLRRVIVDARDLRLEEGGDEELYIEELKARGYEKLLEQPNIIQVECTPTAEGFGDKFDIGSRARILIPEKGLRLDTRIVKFQEKRQKNNIEQKIMFGDLIEG